MKKQFAFAALAVAFAATPSLASEWKLDPSHTNIGFSVTHMMVSETKGSFDKYTGTILLDDKDATKSTVNVEIDTSSVNTKDAKRDGHLQSPDFFDSKTHPKMTFKSKKIEKNGKTDKGQEKYKVVGDLTIRGVTKEVTLDAVVSDEWTDPKEWGGNVHRGVSATGKINRNDFGLKWQTKLDKGGVVVGDEVTLLIDAELIKVQAPAAKK